MPGYPAMPAGLQYILVPLSVQWNAKLKLHPSKSETWGNLCYVKSKTDVLKVHHSLFAFVWPHIFQFK